MSQNRHALLCALSTFAVTVVCGAAHAAEPGRHRFGTLELWLASDSWRVERHSSDTFDIVPIGSMAQAARSVTLTRIPGADLETCKAHARAQLSLPHYGEPKLRAIQIAGEGGIEARAHTRCRNAMPIGIVACFPHGEASYVLTNRSRGCRDSAGNPFSKTQWFEDLTKAIRIAP